MLSSANCAILAAGNVWRSTGHFPSSAAVEGKRHFRFSPLRVATGCRLRTRKKERPGLSPHVSIPSPRLYGLIRSHLHARGRCELFSASAGFMPLPSGVRSERGPHVGIPLDAFHSVASVGLPPYLEGSVESVALDSSYNTVRLNTSIYSQHSFLLSGVRTGVICRHQKMTTDASLSGWGVVFEGRPAYGVWSGKYLTWHKNGLELRAVHLALTHSSIPDALTCQHGGGC